MEGRCLWEGYPSLGCHWTMSMRWKLLVVGGSRWATVKFDVESIRPTEFELSMN